MNMRFEFTITASVHLPKTKQDKIDRYINLCTEHIHDLLKKDGMHYIESKVAAINDNGEYLKRG